MGAERAPDAFALRLRHDRGRCVAALARRFGPAQLDRIEDAVQEAMARALERWPSEGVPDDATAWLLRVAHNKLIDAARSEARKAALEAAPDPLGPEPRLDDELGLMFLCCHPTLPRPAQVALTLKVAWGFTTQQIARAFLVDEATLAQRIVRAKARLRREGVRFELPEPGELSARLTALLDVLYSVFNEGYSPTEGDAAVKESLCAESLRLVRTLASAPACAPPQVDALRALFCFQAARSAARTADDGSLLLLHEQDRARWDSELLAEGFTSLGRASTGNELSRFHLEAGIAACHAAAASHDAIDWPRIVALYDELRRLAASPIVEVNRAIAVGMAEGAEAGLEQLDSISERELIEHYPYALAAYAELHASLGNLAQARAYLSRALEHQPAPAQRKLLERKLGALER